MSLELDLETLQALGWGTEAERDAPLARQASVRTRRVGRARDEVKFDGRSRRNWRHKRQGATKDSPTKAQGDSA